MDEFDYNYYLSHNKDLNTIVSGLNDKLKSKALYDHFIKHGKAEGRKHRFLSLDNDDTDFDIKEQYTINKLRKDFKKKIKHTTK